MKNFLFAACMILVQAAVAQQPFSVSLAQSPITAVPKIHSYAFAEWNGKWVMVGGRMDGLHSFLGGMGFLKYMRNDSVYVVDPVSNTQWVSPLTALPAYVRESLSSSNSQFYQDDSMLYVIGGYGRCDSLFTNITFPTLSAINLNLFIDAVMNGDSINSSVRQLRDSNIIVTGGHLKKIDSTYYLIFGHRFDGMYSKLTGSTLFIQQYTNSVKKFSILDDGVSLGIGNYTSVSDTDNFHRRDLNVVEQIYPDGDFGYTAFGGVFQKTATLPFLTPIDITSDSIIHQSTFNQNLNQYETAAMPVFDSLNNYMHTVFFGGMSLYTYDTVNQVLVQDTLIPFVNTISKVSRDASGNLTEFKLPVEMPSLLGTNARFIADPNVQLRHGSIIDLNTLSGNTRVGWIINGIHSDYPNIADLDPESFSRPNQQVYEVWIDVSNTGLSETSLSNSILGLNVYPNPTENTAYIDFMLNEAGPVNVQILDSKGSVMKKFNFKGKKSEIIHLPVSTGSFSKGMYTCVIRTADCTKEAKFIVK